MTLEDNESFSINLLKNALHPQQKRVIIKKEIKFLEFSKKLIGELMAEQRIGNALVYQTSVNRFISFCDNREIKFDEINFEILESFKRKLASEGVKINTIGNYLRTIRAIFNKAIKVKLIERSLHPFNEIQIKVARTAKRAFA